MGTSFSHLHALKPTILLALLLLAMVTGCSKLESYTAGEVSEEQAGDVFEPALYWAIKQVTTTVVDVPILSSVNALSAQTSSYFVFLWEQDGKQVYQHETLCLSDISEVMGMKTMVPEQYYTYMGAQVRSAIIDEMVVGGGYLAADNLSVDGAELADPWNDPLPTSPDDPTEFDEDHDDAPGFTSILEGWLGDGHAEVYVAQRTVTTMAGTILRQDRIEGYLTMTLEQSILGASEGDEWAAMDGYGSRPDDDPSHNFFIMQALNGPLTCDQLLAKKNTLF